MSYSGSIHEHKYKLLLCSSPMHSQSHKNEFLKQIALVISNYHCLGPAHFIMYSVLPRSQDLKRHLIILRISQLLSSFRTGTAAPQPSQPRQNDRQPRRDRHRSAADVIAPLAGRRRAVPGRPGSAAGHGGRDGRRARRARVATGRTAGRVRILADQPGATVECVHGAPTSDRARR